MNSSVFGIESVDSHSSETLLVLPEVEEKNDLDASAVKVVRNTIISVIENDLVKISKVINRDIQNLQYIFIYIGYNIQDQVIKFNHYYIMKIH